MLIKYENQIKALQSQIQRLESGSSDMHSSLQSEITLLQNANDMLNDRIESLLKSINGKDNDLLESL
ncbi:hypothetical protein [Helicobacter marmotae]|uniref:Uncharacterized protein n=1 Tax=Helicobacter marmotae TaxID=152490 RepID=A0A3D8I7S0_9HELI|nr:hypothetical protein [Helicobacter marmotae]RDU61036.1 hypothetical protein CQA63_00580 [Helicobacter marmotae]